MQKVLMLLLLALGITVTALGEKCTIAKNGQAQVVIVLPKNAAPPVKFAATELQHYLDEITGAKISIVDKLPQGVKGIFLGDCPAVRQQGINPDKIERDSYIIKATDGNLYITGKDDHGDNADIAAKLNVLDKASYENLKTLMAPDNWQFNRGTLYGVYRLLEEFGVHWFMPGSEGERVPALKNLSFSGQLKEKPYFYTRVVSSFARAPWGYIKNESVNFKRDFTELKSLHFTPKTNILWNLRMRGSSMPLPLNHHPSGTGWQERFGKTHPKYFALLPSGKRDLNVAKVYYRAHLCYNNPEVMKEILNEINAFRTNKNALEIGIPERIVKRYPYNYGWDPNVALGRIFSLLPEDSFVACKCPECRKYEATAGTSFNIKDSKLVWSFIDRCAREIKRSKHSDTKIVCMAYSSYSYPYSNMKKLPDNVIVGICAKDLNRPYNLFYKDNYLKFEQLIEQWHSVSNEPLAFWMHFLYRWAQPKHYAVPIHIPAMYDRVVKTMAVHGRHAYIQINEDSIMYELFNRYMLMKMFYNPELKWQNLFNDYLENFYGPKAAPVIKQIYDDIEKKCIEMLTSRAGQVDTWSKIFTTEVIAGYRSKAIEAEKLAAGTKYQNAVKLFSQYYIGLMEKGQNYFDRNIRQTMKKGINKVSFCNRPDSRGTIKIDGELDEKAWGKPVRRIKLVNNINGKETKLETRVALTRDKENLYFAFICHDPDTMQRTPEKESVEIFLDTNHDHNSYYQLYITMDGKLKDAFFEGNGEQGNSSWSSNSKLGIKRYKDKWIVEIAIPRKSFPEDVTYPSYPWGANFCRTMENPPIEEDRYSTWSQVLRGSFHQPDMFGHLFFVN